MVAKSRYLTASWVLIGVLFSGGVLVAMVDFLSADSKAIIIGDGSSVVVTGQIQCTDGDTFGVTAIVAQNVKQDSVIATGSTSGTDTCTGQLQTYVVTAEIVYPANGTFKKGPASLTLQAQSCNVDPIVGCSDPVTVQTKTHLQ
jgi:hypothetical protein